ncbi:exodeoxyribonuclease VII small subunit [Sulfurospirillum sp. 1612]|uniref:exodeoxyribonuclease VII small subunit n=1 Tax=Sulfurospirillum sp. 1612 TaxID=3094835 RepID=UPI002F935A73
MAKELINETTDNQENEGFEEKLVKAKKILETLGNPEIPLKDAMLGYKQGIAILNEASEIIENAKLEYEQLQPSNED